MPATKEDADRVLKAHRYGKACYPCAKRKVKCSGTYPCTVCVQRGHPEICIVEPPKPRRKATNANQPPDIKRELSSPSNHHTTPSSASDGPEAGDRVSPPSTRSPPLNRERIVPTILGGHATSSFLNDAPRSHLDDELDDIRPALGLSNTLTSDPYMSRRGYPEVAQLINSHIPTHAEILKYTDFYQTLFAPFYPLIPIPEDLDTTVCSFLELVAQRENSGLPVFQAQVTQDQIAGAALMLAVMARGVQLSDLGPTQRVELSREYARRSYRLSRLANYLLQPTLNTVQANLVLQHVLQNDGQADAAWSFLGQVIRLAQSLGVHQPPRPELDEKDRQRQKGLWSMLVWQDCILSLCFDRPPMNLRPQHAFASTRPASQILNYRDYMDELVAWAHDLLETSQECRAAIDGMLKNIRDLEQLQARGSQHLQRREYCSNRKSRIEHHLIRLQTSLCIGLVCRPALKNYPPANRVADHSRIVERLKAGLTETIQAYLDLSSLTILGLRQWTITHAALGSAMVLEYFGLLDAKSSEVQAKFITLLAQHSKTGSADSDETDEASWLTMTHFRALKALQHTVSKRQESRPQSPRPYKQPMTSQYHQQMQHQQYHNQNPRESPHTTWRSGQSISPNTTPGSGQYPLTYDTRPHTHQPHHTSSNRPHIVPIPGIENMGSFPIQQDFANFDWNMAFPSYQDGTTNNPYSAVVDQQTFGF